MRNFLSNFTVAAVISVLVGMPGPALGQDISQYTSFPAFLPRVVSPNILFLLDFSDEMVRPAYGRCNSLLSNCRTQYLVFDDYSPANTYYGYFDAPYKYTYVTGGNFEKLSTGVWGSNWLNWLTMSQFDVLKKVSVGGDISPAPEQANANSLSLKSRLTPKAGGARSFTKVVKAATCLENAPAALCNAAVPQEIPYNWLDTPSDVTPLLSGDHDGKSVPYELPFPFKLAGVPFDHLSIGVDGYLLLAAAPVPSTTVHNIKSDLIPGAAIPDNLLAPLWDDAKMLNNRNSAITAFVSGATPNRVLVVTFENMINDLDVADVKRTLTYQVLLFEGSNQVVFQYKEVQPTNTTFGAGRSATVGVAKDATEAAAIKKYSFNGSRLLRNDMALLATPGYTVIQLTTQASNRGTEMKPAAPIASVTSGATINTFEVYIEAYKKTGTPPNCPPGSYVYRDDSPNRIACYDHELRGLVQDLRDKEGEGNLGFRLAIMKTNSMNNQNRTDGGEVVKHFNNKDDTGWPSLMNDIRSGTPSGDAPLAEALHVAHGYFRLNDNWKLGLGNTAFSSNSNWMTGCSTTGTNWDPFCDQSIGRHVECLKSYVLLISSGHFTHDFGTNFDGSANAVAELAAVTPVAGSRLATENSDATILEEIAYAGRTSDARTTIDGFQNVHLYAVDTYGGNAGIGTAVLKRAAQYGGYKNSPTEVTPPNNPIGYYQPGDGGNLRAKIIQAISDIMKNSASGTSVSVLSTSAGGEGALYQAYFYPARVDEGSTDEVRWPGFLRAFFLDRQGNLLDDSSGGNTPDAALVLNEDKRLEMFLNESESAVKVRRYNHEGVLVSGDPPASVGISMDDILSIWEGGSTLAKRDKSTRKIYVCLPDSSGVVGDCDFNSLNSRAVQLGTGHAASLAPYLRAQEAEIVTKIPVYDADGVLIGEEIISAYTRTATEEAEKVIDFTLGNHIDGFRNRCVTVPGEATEAGCASGKRVWPLGDIIYSTPTLVSVPGERFGIIYGDQSYRVFANTYRQRRSMIYVGANDGKLHAFNGGVYNEGSKPGSGKVEVGWFDANAAAAVNGWGSAELGDELWSFVPYDNLPHLPWLACTGTAVDPTVCAGNDYTHVYYVDQRPKATDARIFTPSVDHPGGWGTILLVPMRLGGGAIDLTIGGLTRPFRSAIYAFDITNPEKKPKLLWRFAHNDLGFTTSYPAIVRIGDGGAGEWFMVVGSGPKNQPGEKDLNRDYNHVGLSTLTEPLGQPGRVFVVDMKTGLARRTFTPVAANGIMGDPTVVDIDLDFTADVIYIGSAIEGTAGRVFRIHTNGDAEPNNWVLSTLFDPNPDLFNRDPSITTNVGGIATPSEMGPLLVGPSVSKDINGNLWVFFGSGRLKSTKDITNTERQRFYGIKDRCAKSLTAASCVGGTGDTFNAERHVLEGDRFGYKRSHLYDAGAIKVRSDTNLESADVKVETLANSLCGTGTTCNYQTMLNNARNRIGWYVDLEVPTGQGSERVLARSSVLGGLLLFTAYKPAGDICSIFGDSGLYALYYETGTAYIRPVLPDDGVYMDGTKEYVQTRADLGKGMPTSVGIAIGETISGFVQKSTGEIIRIETQPGLGVRSGVSSWRETTGGGGNAGIETIYKHIVK